MFVLFSEYSSIEQLYGLYAFKMHFKRKQLICNNAEWNSHMHLNNQRSCSIVNSTMEFTTLQLPFTPMLREIRKECIPRHVWHWTVSVTHPKCKQLTIVYHTIMLKYNCFPHCLPSFLLPFLSLAFIKNISSEGQTISLYHKEESIFRFGMCISQVFFTMPYCQDKCFACHPIVKDWPQWGLLTFLCVKTLPSIIQEQTALMQCFARQNRVNYEASLFFPKH